MSVAVGQQLADKYRLERQLAQGGMGTVWLGVHLNLGRKVAIKFARDDQRSEDAQLRLEREARAAAALSDEHIVRVFDFGRDGATSFLVMEYLEGEDLGVLLSRVSQLTPERARTIIEQAARGVRAVHQAGFIHRDIKPSNLFLVRREPGELVKVLDFGIVKPAFPEAHDTTTTGMILGSAPYMSPEQVRGLPLTPASDLWSLAAVFYSVLAGRPPFDGHNSADVVVRICSETPPPLSERTGLPSEYDRFFERAFARDGRLRWQTADEFLAALNSLPGSQARRESSAPLSPLQPRSRAGRDAETAPLERAPPALVPRHSRVRVAFAFLALGLLAFAGSALLREIKPAPQQSETTRREDSPPAHAEGAPSKLTSAAAEEAAPAPPPQSVSAPRAASSTRPPAPSHGAPVRGQPTPTPPSTDPIFGLPSAHP